MNNEMTGEAVLKINLEGFGCSSARVMDVLINEGQRVVAGQRAIEFESEKAAFELTMPTDGEVTLIHVREGDFVDSVTDLVSFAPSTSDTNSSQSTEDLSSLSALIECYGLSTETSSVSEAVNVLEHSLNIRPSHDGDGKPLARIWQHSLSTAIGSAEFSIPSDNKYIEWFESQIRRKPFFTATLRLSPHSEDRVIGFCNFDVAERVPARSIGVLGMHVIDPNQIWTPSTALFAAACEEATVRGVSQFFAFTDPRNDTAIRLLRSLEFIHIGEVPGGTQRERRDLYALNIPTGA